MKSVLFFCALLLLLISCSRETRRPVDYVDPFICTEGDHGQWDPSATVPFGMVKLGPDTYPSSLTGDGDFAHSGYNYADSIVRGFSHFHKGSSGGGRISDRAGRLSVMPFSRKPTDIFLFQPLAAVDKKSEKAKAGFYTVFLKEDGILAELTATPHAGIHRYTFPAGKPARLYIYKGNKNRSSGISFRQNSPQKIEGFLQTYAGVHFVFEFSEPVVSFSSWDGTSISGGVLSEKSADGGLICDFGDLSGKPLVVTAAISLNSQEAAAKNAGTECEGRSFDKLRNEAASLWNEKLSGIEVEGNEEYKTIFYTALFHTCFLPTVISDPGGDYPGLDQRVHNAEGYQHYYDYAFWDSFRTKYPLYSLWLPGVYRDIASSLRDIYFQADNCAPFPDSDHKPHGPGFEYRGKTGYQPFNSCRHEHMLMVLADAFFKGLTAIDMKTVYPYMKKETLLQMPEKYDPAGYIPARPDQTGEYAWDNWCMAKLAGSLGFKDDSIWFGKRAEYWRNTWDPALKFFRARADDGSWLDFPDDPTDNREKYTYEGSKWQYRWNVVHDIPSLIAYFGGKEPFLKELEYFFDHDLYTAGNQIDLHAPFLFNMAGAPWLSQNWVCRLLTDSVVQRYGTHNFFPEPVFDRIYKAKPDGFLEEMDDDYGCMSAWYTMAAMGLYQVCPGDPVYQITTPVFDKVTLHLDQSFYSGKIFTIKTVRSSPGDRYIGSATLNGKPFNRSWISHDEIVKGGEMVFNLQQVPNKNWGIE